jgi:hypothetical protein
MFVGWPGWGNLCIELLLLDPLVGLELAEMPLSRGRLPLASRVLVTVCANTGVAERMTMARAVFSLMRWPLQVPWMASLRGVIASTMAPARDFCRHIAADIRNGTLIGRSRFIAIWRRSLAPDQSVFERSGYRFALRKRVKTKS